MIDEQSIISHPIGHNNVVFGDRWSLVTGGYDDSDIYTDRYVTFQVRWSLMAVVFQVTLYMVSI